MEILRTPEERFANLPGFAFAPAILRICLDTKESVFIIWMKARRNPSKYFFACTANQRGAISIGK